MFKMFQVCKLIEDSEKHKNAKINIPQDTIAEWLLENKVLSVAFESMLESVPNNVQLAVFIISETLGFFSFKFLYR